MNQHGARHSSQQLDRASDQQRAGQPGARGTTVAIILRLPMTGAERSRARPRAPSSPPDRAKVARSPPA